MQYIYQQLIKIFENHLNIKILNYYPKFLYDHKNEYTWEELLWKLKGKKLAPYEKDIIKRYKNIHKDNKTLSNSLKRGAISTKTRKIVNIRDKKQCVYCGATSYTELAHIKSRGAGGAGEVNNLITLCIKHHKILDNPVGANELVQRKKIKNFIEQWREGAKTWYNWYMEKH